MPIKEVKGHYNPKEIETRIREFWEANKVPQKLTKLDPKKTKFYLLDGPPYVNEMPHVGSIKTTIMKDMWSKFKLMQGFSSWHQPGFDCHGLPIEKFVEQKFGVKSKKQIEEIGVEKFIKACREHALKYKDEWLKLYRLLGAWRGYHDPYLTLEDCYIESAWWTTKQFFEKGILVKGEKPIYWCPKCETALSGYEVTDKYEDVKDPSIYVKFPLIGKKNEYIVAWTTTPWTLISNVALAVHPDEYYVKAEIGKEILIIAEKLVEHVLKEVVKTDYTIIDKVLGKDLEGIKYKPLFDIPTQRKLSKNDNAHRIYLSIPVLIGKSYKHGGKAEERSKEFVTMEEGSGVVHTAPGHGPEDHIFGQHYKLPIASPLDDEGRFTNDAGEFAKVFVKDADKLIVEKLEKHGLLLHFDWLVHSYPLCWRCSSPLIFRISKQWFFAIDTIKQKMIEENEKIVWLPAFGKERFANWLNNAVDWCISQQRYWGIPLPIWICQKCGNIDVVGGLDELRERATKKLPKKIDLHKHVVDKIKITCKNCQEKMKRVPDTMNVWFDSGIATWASLGYPYKNKELFESVWNADMICESQDQIRGWFYSLMFTGVATFDQSPYKSVSLMGWVLDEKGVKMSKSLGNVIWTTDAYEKLAADILRLYYCWEVAPWEVQNFSFKTAEEIRKALNILWNSYSFFTTYVDSDFKSSLKKLKIEDKWILSKLNSLIYEVTQHIEIFEFHQAGRRLMNFVVNDLSRFYIKVIRNRVWVSERGEDKLSALSTLHETLVTLSKLLAPITPFLAEEIYQNLVSNSKIKSVFTSKWPEVNSKLVNAELENEMEIAKKIIEACLSARQQANIKLRWPVAEVLICPKDEQVASVVNSLNEILKFMCNAKSVKVVKEKPDGYLEAEFDFGKVYINKKLDKTLLEEALVRELIREIQEMRKRNKFQVKERILLTLNSDEETNQMLKKHESLLAKEVGASSVAVGKLEGDVKGKLEFENKAIDILFSKSK